MIPSQYESSEEENESEEEHLKDHYYEEVEGEYDYEYEHDDEEYLYVQSPRHSGKTRSSRSSQRTSMASSDFRYHVGRKSMRKSMGHGLLHGHDIVFEEEIQHDDNQDLIDALPEDIASVLKEYWLKMEDLYDSMADNALENIHKSHKKLSSYPGHFQEDLLKQLEVPDDRANIADVFKADFNRVPTHIRTSDQVKPVLYKRIGEFLVKVEGITEEKYANSKRNAYKILSRGFITSESEKMARLFGAVLQAETDRFADTIRFINEHYYNLIAIELGMPNKVRWKEILEIGLIKKKFICEHVRQQCLIEEIEGEQEDGESWRGTEKEISSSSDSDICGGGMRGQDLTLICENEDESTPSDEEMTDESLFRKYGEEEEQIDFGDNDMKMNGEMKLSLEFDGEEFLGEGDWDAYRSQRNSALSTGTAREDTASGDLQLKGGRKSQNNSSKRGKNAAKDDSTAGSKPTETGKQSTKAASQGGSKTVKDESKTKSDKEKKGGDQKKNSITAGEATKRKSKDGGKGNNEDGNIGEEEEESSHFDFAEEYDEELEMEPELEVQNPDYYEDEYPGEFWEGEGWGTGQYKRSKSTGRNRDSSVKFDEKETYIRDFFWDSDPSKQDATDMSKAGNETQECADEGYYDQEELYDDEDVFYDRDEFFERDMENPAKLRKEGGAIQEPEDLHFAIFGKERDDANIAPMSLLDKLLLKWNSSKEKKMSKDYKSVKEGSNIDIQIEGKQVDEEEKVENAPDGTPPRITSSSAKLFTPSTPASAIKPVDIAQKMDGIHPVMGEAHSSFRVSFFDFSGGNIGLLKLSPARMAEMNEGKARPTVEVMLRQKRPLLECFVNLHDEIWNGFEIAFVEARTNIEMLADSLKQVVSKAYPLEEPKDPCEEEPDLNELIARGDAIKEKYRISERHADRTSKAQKHVHLKDSFDEEEDAEMAEEGESSNGEQEEDNEEEENNEGSPKSSFVELVPVHSRKTSAELLLESSDIATGQEPTEKRSSLTDSEQRMLKSEKKSSIDGDDSGKKKSMFVHEESGSGSNSNNEKQQSVTEQDSGTAEEEKEHEKKHSTTDSANNATSETEKGSPLEEVNSPQSDVRTGSTEPKSSPLERTAGDIDIRLHESPMEPTPEEKKILKRARHALLKSKLQNWEKTLELEKERLNRQLTVIEDLAQYEFRLLKELPYKVWESSKSQAANVYIDDLKRDAELGDIFKLATQDGSPLYGKFLIDRRDLMLLLKDNQTPIPMRYTDEYEEFLNSNRGKKRSKKKSEYYPAEE